MGDGVGTLKNKVTSRENCGPDIMSGAQFGPSTEDIGFSGAVMKVVMKLEQQVVSVCLRHSVSDTPNPTAMEQLVILKMLKLEHLHHHLHHYTAAM